MLRGVREGSLLRDGARDAPDLRLPVATPVSAADAPGLPDGAEAAWSEFHERLRAFVARRVRNAADAEDIVQGVFLRMHRGLSTLRGVDNVGAWLYRAARNAIVDHYRRPSHRREEAFGDTRAIDTRHVKATLDTESEVAGTRCAAECIRPLVERLPDTYRRAVELVELQGLTHLRASRIERLSLPGMKARVQRGRRRLKAMLLEHCRVALDARGALAGCERRDPSGRACGRDGPRDPGAR